jgi:ribonuclease R
MRTLLKAVAEDHGFSTEIPEGAEDEARLFPDSLTPSDYAGREDLRNLETFTIDGATAKDFDDAVSLEKTENGWRLGVHIADVSHYIRPGSAIDRDAFERGTSLYLPGCTVPMLPEELSNNICSLMPDADRLAMSLFMDVSAAGKVVGRATAFLYCLLGVKTVYANVMSRPAAQVLENSGITAQWGKLVEGIINRKGTGPCPFEAAVMEIDDPEEALAAIRNKMAQM